LQATRFKSDEDSSALRRRHAGDIAALEQRLRDDVFRVEQAAEARLRATMDEKRALEADLKAGRCAERLRLVKRFSPCCPWCLLFFFCRPSFLLYSQMLARRTGCLQLSWRDLAARAPSFSGSLLKRLLIAMPLLLALQQALLRQSVMRLSPSGRYGAMLRPLFLQPRRMQQRRYEQSSPLLMRD
jgi:hypothetical protein